MSRIAYVTVALLALGVGAVPSGAVEKIAAPRSDHPVKIVHWRGPAGKDDGTDRCKVNRQDDVRVIAQPQAADIGNLRRADIVYTRNHGGVLQTHEYWKPVKERFFALKNLKFSTDDAQGPSLVVAWGCQNYDETYARAMGVNCDSRTKAFLAPRTNVQQFFDSAAFQDTFFEEFSRGNVSIEQAARKGHEAWKARLASSGYSAQLGSFEETLGICGNKDLTLDQIRANLDRRDRATAAPPGSGKPERYVSASSRSTAAYCTNNPRIQSAIPISPVVNKTKASAPPPSPRSPSPNASPPSAAPSAAPAAAPTENDKVADEVETFIRQFENSCFSARVKLGDPTTFRKGLAAVKIVRKTGGNPQHVEYARGALFGLLPKPPNELRLPFDPFTAKVTRDNRLSLHHEALHQLESIRGTKRDNADPRAERNTNYISEVVGALTTWAIYEKQIQSGVPWPNQMTPQECFRELEDAIRSAERTWKPDPDLQTWSGIRATFEDILALYESGDCGPALQAVARERAP